MSREYAYILMLRPEHYKAEQFIYLQIVKYCLCEWAFSEYCLKVLHQRQKQTELDTAEEQSAMEVHRLFAETEKVATTMQPLVLMEKSEEELATVFKLLPRIPKA